MQETLEEYLINKLGSPDEAQAFVDGLMGFLRDTPLIKPSDIDTSQYFWEAFGNHETEISARWIVRFCQERNSWRPFAYDELNSFCKANGHRGDFWFNRLGKEGFVRKYKDGLWSITHRFVCRCYEASPMGGI